MSDAKTRLIEIVRERSFSLGPEMKLASGRTSSFYFNMKPTMLHPEGAHLIATLVLDAIAADRVDLIGGLEMGAVPLAASVIALSQEKGKTVRAFFVRKQAKEYGTQKLVEGLGPDETMAGQNVVVLEDVTTTGGSAIKAVEALKADGANILKVITVVDRQEGAAQNFENAGIVFHPLLDAALFTSAE
ncbi:MAG: orotate phosphoribosyltransferase [Hyphomicrobiaceae bacterium]